MPIHDNQITNTDSRGIAVGSAWFVDIRRNTVTNTGSHGIEVCPDTGDVPITSSYNPTGPHLLRPWSVILDQNEIESTGVLMNNHPTSPAVIGGHGMWFGSVDHLTAGFNTTNNTTGDGVFAGNSLYQGNIGPRALFTNYGPGESDVEDPGTNVATTIW